MSARLKSSIKFIIFLGVGVLLMYFAFRNVDLSQMLRDMKEAHYGWVLFSLLFSLVAHMSRAYRWGMLIEPLHVRPKFSNLFYSLCLGYFANMAFPRLGEVTRCTALYEVEETSIDSLFGTVIAERVIDLISLIFLIFLTLAINFNLFGNFFMTLLRDKLSFVSHISSTFIFILAIAAISLIVAVYTMRKRIAKIPAISKVISFLKGIVDGLQTVLKLKKWKAFLFHSVLIWFLYFVAGYFSFFAIPETTELGFSAALFILVLGGIGMSAPVQGGIGAYHFLVAGGLALYGIIPHPDPITGKEISKGLMYATIVHSSQMLLILVLGSVSILMLNIEKRKQLKVS